MIELQYKFIKREDQILDFFDENNNGGNNRVDLPALAHTLHQKAAVKAAVREATARKEAAKTAANRFNITPTAASQTAQTAAPPAMQTTAPPTAQVPATLTAEETSAASQVQNTTREITMTKAESVCPAGQKLS